MANNKTPNNEDTPDKEQMEKFLKAIKAMEMILGRPLTEREKSVIKSAI